MFSLLFQKGFRASNLKVTPAVLSRLSIHRLTGRRRAPISASCVDKCHPTFDENISNTTRDISEPAHKQQNEKWLISQLLSHFKQTSEVRHYLKYFGNVNPSDKFAIIRFSGDVLNNREHLMQIASALSFLKRVGLLPIVVHGAGLFTGRRCQGVAKAAQLGSPTATLTAVQSHMQAVNTSLVNELRFLNVEAAPLCEKVFGVGTCNRTSITEENSTTMGEWAGITGVIKAVDMRAIRLNIKAGRIPVVASMGRVLKGDKKGKLLTFSTWDATAALTREIQPFKVILLRPEGSLKTKKGDCIKKVILSTDYQRLVKSDPSSPTSEHHLCEGDQTELADIKNLMNGLQSGCTIAVTSPSNLAHELLSHKGEGTMVVKGEKVWTISSMDDSLVKKESIASLLEEVFKAKLACTFMPSLPDRLLRLYLAESYRGVAIVTKGPYGIPYLDKFAVHPDAQGDRLGELVWQAMITNEKKLFWRSRTANPVNGWYFEQSDGTFKAGYWTIFWRGLVRKEVDDCIKAARNYEATFIPKDCHGQNSSPVASSTDTVNMPHNSYADIAQPILRHKIHKEK